jgi:hypothetical protein
LTSFIGSTAAGVFASAARNGEYGADSFTWTVAGSTASTDVTGPICARHTPCPASSRCRLPTTSSAVMARPLENVTPSRRWKTYVVGSGVSQLDARAGSIAKSGPTVTSVSYDSDISCHDTATSASCGSSPLARPESMGIWMSRVPPPVTDESATDR